MTTTGTPREAAFMFAAGGDWARAVTSARESLAADPEDAHALSLLALGLANLNQAVEAVDVARRAVGLDPELAFAHYALGHALLEHDEVAAAKRSALEALRLDPDSEGYALLGHVFARQRKWQDALDAAEEGLQLNAEHSGCANLRVMALAGLGRKDEAAEVARETLAADPDNADSHAHHGWLLLRQAKYDEALESFRTALRLDASHGYARAGILEALKARSGVYRLMLRYSLWIGSLDARSRWFVLIGLFVGARIARGFLQANPEWWPVLGPALIAYTVFAFSTWMAEPISNLLLRLNPFGRLILNEAEIAGSNVVGGCLAVAAAAGLLFLATNTRSWLIVAMVAVGLLIPTSATFGAHGTRAWDPLLKLTTLLAALGILGVGLSFASSEFASLPLTLLGLGVIVFPWVANYLIGKYN